MDLSDATVTKQLSINVEPSSAATIRTGRPRTPVADLNRQEW
jgi:hypothetical protein